MANVIELKNSDNIIQFPGSTREVPKNQEEVTQRVDNIKHLHIQEVLSTMVPIIFNQMATAGFDCKFHVSRWGSWACHMEDLIELKAFEIA